MTLIQQEISMRPSQRQPNELRAVTIECDVNRYAEGSVLYTCGHTKVLCTVSAVEGVPRFLRDSNQGWLTAEYGMLPRSTHTRMDREAARGKQSGRTMEIQRLIGRSLRAMVDLKKLGQWTLMVDCDVIQADGGTRTAAINGGALALIKAIQKLQYDKKLLTDPLLSPISAISCGVVKGQVVLDLDDDEDSKADADITVDRNAQGLIEIQGTSEHNIMTDQQLHEALNLATSGIEQLLSIQKDHI